MEKRFMTAQEVMQYLTLGRNRADSFCTRIGAKRKIGKRSLYDKQRIDDYFDGEDTSNTIKEEETNVSKS